MSQYESTTVAIQATPTNAELIAEMLQRELGAPSTWVRSGHIRSARLALCSNDEQQVRAALASPALASGAIDSSVVQAAHAELRNGPINLGRVNSLLAPSLMAAEGIAERAERRGLAVLAERALASINFRVRAGEGRSLSALEARRGHEVLLMRLDDGGGMVVDWMGHGGNDCEQSMKEVHDALQRHGVDVAVRRQIRHGSSDGGTLIDQAVRAGNGDLVAGVLADAEPTTAPQSQQSWGTPLPQRVRN